MAITTIIDVFTILVSIYLAVKTVKKVGTSSRYVIYYFTFLILVVPLILDYIIGKPDYLSWYGGRKHYGFIVSYDDPLTRIFYDAFLLLFQFIILYCNHSNHEHLTVTDSIRLSNINNGWLFGIMAGFALLPVALVVLLPLNKMIMFIWGWRDSGLFNATSSKYYFTIEKLTYIGVACALLLVLTPANTFSFSTKYNERIFRWSKVLWVAIAYMDICIESKRSIIIFVLAVVITFLIDVIPRRKIGWILLCGMLFSAVIIGLSIFVKTTSRGYSDWISVYSTLRIDFFRDDTIKMLLYSILHPGEIKVLNYPFESYIKQIPFLLPLNFTHIPRVGYNSYFTCAVLHVPFDPSINYITCSMFDEMLANFNLLAYLVAPIFTIWYSNKADQQTTVMRTMMVAGYVLMSMYSLHYIVWFVQIVFTILFFQKFRLKFGNKYLT